MKSTATKLTHIERRGISPERQGSTPGTSVTPHVRGLALQGFKRKKDRFLFLEHKKNITEAAGGIEAGMA
jgi:hypothetical protein